MWTFTQELTKDNSNYPQWHHKTLYPYPLNLTDLTVAVVTQNTQPKDINGV